MSDTWRETNRRLWDELASIHPGTAFYGVDRFKAGADALLPIELAEMGDSPASRCCICNAISAWTR